MRLSDAIEQFIKEMMQAGEQPGIDLKRNELADYFHCAPSQINYVLSTRFTPDHGYVTSSQRGGGGYIRIVRIVRRPEEQLNYLLNERIGNAITAADAMILCGQLLENDVITEDEALLMKSAVSQAAFAVPIPENVKDAVRAKVLRSMLLEVMQRKDGGRDDDV